MTVKPEYKYPEKIVIGTRGSPLALVQANIVKDKIAKIGQNIDVTLRIIRTSGDWNPQGGEVRLEALEGGKAQFAKEIEEALLSGEIDIAVHSMKDMETVLPEGLVIPFMLPREDVRDAFISEKASVISDLPQGAIVGTASVRRQAFLLNKRPDLNVVPFRGNVQTRLDKLRDGQVDATFLACAGLNRLGMADEVTSAIEIDEMLPAVGQGAVGIEIRSSDVEGMSFISQFSCLKTYVCVECERGVLRALGGSCHTPVGVHATFDNGAIDLRVKVVSLDGTQCWSDEETGVCNGVNDAISLGERVGVRLKGIVPDGVLG
ncbi:MAG: hydroxymethylbilane synthase [Alphaproteobacteria bacterium]